MPVTPVIGRSTECAEGSPRRCLRALSSGLFAVALGACTTGIPVRSDFPSPLIVALPLTAGVYYEPGFRDFSYSEKLGKGREWTVDLGDANVQLFDRVLSRLFERAVPLDDLSPGASAGAIDLVIAPSVEKFEFALPADSGAPFVEAWVRYHVRLYDLDRELIVDWQIAGYGKRAAEGEGGATDHVGQAAYTAMRDVAATISLEFSEQPEISDWLERRGSGAQPAGDASDTSVR